MVVGSVIAVRRYPVKSMLGEALDSSEVTELGLAGDRVRALVHRQTGHVASAKHPRLWRGLLAMAAAYRDPAVRITVPGGADVWSTDPGADRELSRILGQPVHLTATPPPAAALERAVPEEVLRRGVTATVPVTSSRLGGQSPEGTFFDFAPIHLISSATLDRIGGLSPRGVVEAERYRPNLVLGTPGTGFLENGWTGGQLRIGRDLALRITAPTPRCAVPTLAHGDLAPDPAALRVPARHNRLRPLPQLDPQPCAGSYAQVLRPGRVAVGDEVRLV